MPDRSGQPGDELAAAAPLLRVHGLVCQRGERRLFEPLTFALGVGAIVWLRGANGQGKTTLLRTLAGLASPAEGTITWESGPGGDGDGSDEGGPSGDSPRPVYVAHANALKDDLTVAESLRFLLLLDGCIAAPARLDAALARFALDSRRDAFVRTLSQGQRRRVALARLAAMPGARPWLLDEPYDALDAAGIACLDALLVEHARRGGSVILTSHMALSIDDPVPERIELHEPRPA